MSGSDFEETFGIRAGTVPCRRCGDVAPEERERERILGEYHGAICLDCLPALEDEIRIGHLTRAGVPPLFLKKMGMGPWRAMPPEKPWTLILGPVGCGKTHAAVEMMVGRAVAKFEYWPDLVERRRLALKKWDLEDPLSKLKTYEGLLVLDDLGAELVTDCSKEAANLLLSARYNAEAPTIITSNHGVVELAKLYGERIASRIAELARLVELAQKVDRRRVSASRPARTEIPARATPEAPQAGRPRDPP